ncbi:spore coat protein [Candidatus Beckwithbacteria bacterium CG10_big_fil_rev_8_21_14_0_10_34_10]|uniref:glucose-1-phosphate thymidylyltransferase n=1 Tax=Candidatus Beckwithbacteria bacterium CG10_big_fil_rev_8_21_14_0_10_34_10 TaxID=1974495 RepID=A0A2H0WA10_9BACT|nr:MAG: spore coat protein [Candidatus Beckwithbacteria bacterium CG10_big_fil_rev_8_21_14_0_10_34_10]
MKGAVLAGGFGTRLYPLTFATNKHLLPVYSKPMCFYPVETLVKAGIKEVILVSSGPHAGHFIQVLKNGQDLGLDHLEYAYQENPKGGIADALSVCEDFAEGGPLAVILGDNTTDADISSAVASFKDGALVFLKKYEDKKMLKRFGVPVFDESNKRIVEVEEKPENPKSNYAQTGLYLYDRSVFQRIKKLIPSARGELEISSLNSLYAQDKKLYWAELKGYWQDAGTFRALFEANKYWAGKSE